MTDTRTGLRQKGLRLPREVWIASISQVGLAARDVDEMVGKMLDRMAEVVHYRPDIVCLPEAFPFVHLSTPRPPAAEVAEVPLGPIAERFGAFAERNSCYVICPIYTREGDRVYNAAVVIDREGHPIGEYRKTRLTTDEMTGGLTPGPVDPPVFATDFGTIGVQICFDIEWPDGWQKLRRAGAEIVFWPSAFAGGQAVNGKAWMNHYVVVSSTRKGTTKICDITGEEVAATGLWEPKWVCASVNLEKVYLHTWPFCKRFDDLKAKYGPHLAIRTFHEEEWTAIESRSADLKVADVMREFDMESYEAYLGAAEVMQAERRPT